MKYVFSGVYDARCLVTVEADNYFDALDRVRSSDYNEVKVLEFSDYVQGYDFLNFNNVQEVISQEFNALVEIVDDTIYVYKAGKVYSYCMANHTPFMETIIDEINYQMKKAS
jgi:hypothetical protein